LYAGSLWLPQPWGGVDVGLPRRVHLDREGSVSVTTAERVVESFRQTPRAAGHSKSTRRELRAALEAADLLEGLDGFRVRPLDEDEAL
jgi:hypothetical protein